MIRVGEKILSQHGPKRPLLLGSGFTVIGLILLSLTFLPEVWYIISSIVGYLLFGTGLGLYATPSLIQQLLVRQMISRVLLQVCIKWRHH